MEIAVIVLNYMVFISFAFCFLFLLIYALLLMWQKIKKKQIIHNRLLKVRYIVTAVPFVILGFYVCSMVFFMERVVDIIILSVFGAFLILYPIFKCVSAIKDIDYFGGIDG